MIYAKNVIDIDQRKSVRVPRKTYRAALLWTISNRWMSFCWYGSHTELAYSRVGFTRDTYAFSLIDLLEVFMVHDMLLTDTTTPHRLVAWLNN
jgi:hypothetical protein